MFIIPTKLRYFYEIDPHAGLSSIYTWLAIAGHGALLGGAAFLARHRKMLAGFGIFAMYLAFLPESGVFPILHLVFEHRAYFPMLFFLIAIFPLSRSFPGASRNTAVILLPVIAILTPATSARIEQVSTLEKWAVDTYRHRKPTRASNLDLLNFLTAEKSRQLSMRYCREMIERDPDYLPYTLFLRSYTYPDDSPLKQKETLELIAKTLIREKGSLEPDVISISNLVSFLVRQTALVTPDPLTRLRTLEPVFRNLLPDFLADPELFHGHIELHKSNLAQLMRHYENTMEKGEIPERDFIEYLNILGTLSIYYPKTIAEIDGLSDRLKKDHPGRAALVDGAAAYYRDLRRELKITVPPS